MPELPLDPLVPAEIDLRGFAAMPLDVLRLRDSELTSTPDAELFRVAVLSWCVAWHQLPAGSLPDDDATLARLLGFGRDLKGWKRLRAAGGLRGWIRCTDGRLYHPVVAVKALEAWGYKVSARKKRERDAERLRKWRLAQGISDGETHFTPPHETHFNAEREERIGSDRIGTERIEAGSPSPAPAEADQTTTALAKRIKGVDSHRVRDAVARGDLIDLVASLGGNVAGARRAEWMRDADGMQIGEVAVILAWARFVGEPIREPSGFRKANVRWMELTPAEQRQHCGLLREFGLPVPGEAA